MIFFSPSLKNFRSFIYTAYMQVVYNQLRNTFARVHCEITSLYTLDFPPDILSTTSERGFRGIYF